MSLAQCEGSTSVVISPTAGPAADEQLLVVAAGGTITVTGEGFGTASGAVWFTGASGPATVQASVATWSNTSISSLVPEHAVSGPISVRLASGDWDDVVSTVVILEAPNSVARLDVTSSQSVVSGQTEDLTVTALDQEGAPVQGAPVSLFDGLEDSAEQATNASGTTVVEVPGSETEELLVHSGAAWATACMMWSPLPGPVFSSLTMLPDAGPS